MVGGRSGCDVSVARNAGSSVGFVNALEIILGTNASNIADIPKTNAMIRMNGLEILEDTATLKILNLPPRIEISINTAPNTKRLMIRFSGMVSPSFRLSCNGSRFLFEGLIIHG